MTLFQPLPHKHGAQRVIEAGSVEPRPQLQRTQSVGPLQSVLDRVDTHLLVDGDLFVGSPADLPQHE